MLNQSEFANFEPPILYNTVPPSIDRLVHNEVSKQCQKHPNANALLTETRLYTYDELESYYSKIADFLKHEIKIKHQEIVALCFPKSPLAIVSMLGILKAGGTCLPLDPAHPTARLQSILKAASTQIILGDNNFQVREQLPHTQWVDVEKILKSKEFCIQRKKAVDSYLAISPSDQAFVLFTSGSTGTPKAVVLTHLAICSSAHYHGVAMGINDYSKVFQYAAYTFDMSIYDIFTTLMCGGYVCIPSEYSRQHRLAESINEFEANWAFFTPTLLSTLQPSEVPTLRTILLAGEPVPQSIVETWAGKVRLLNGYGSTECSTCFVGHLKEGDDPRCIGSPKGVIAHLVDPKDCNKLITSGPGELIVIGPVLASGYLNSSYGTKPLFLQSSTCKGSDLSGSKYQIYRTGDICEMSEDGTYRFLGRRDTIVKVSGGLRVELGDIEYQILKNEVIARCLVVYPSRGVYAEKLTGVLQLKLENEKVLHQGSKDSSTLQQKLMICLEKVLPDYMVPRTWVFVETIPITSSGKIDRKKLSAFLEAKSGSMIVHDYHGQKAMARTPLTPDSGSNSEYQISENTDPCPDLLQSPFLELGLDSINLITLSKILKKAYSVELSVAALGSLSLEKLRIILSAPAPDVKSQEKSASNIHAEFIRIQEKLQRISMRFRIETETTSLKRGHNIFLTGATGFLGTRILITLLQRLPTASKVIVIVRSQSPESAFSRIYDSIRVTGVHLSLKQLAKIEIWLGDLGLENFGITPAQWSRLCSSEENDNENVDAIIHNGAIVNWSIALQDLENVNVISTVTLLNCLLARLSKRLSASFVYVSGGRALEIATGIDPANRSSIVHSMLVAVERFQLPMNGYDVSKILSELLVASASESMGEKQDLTVSLRTQIIRPGYIISDPSTRDANSKDYIWRVVASAIRLGKHCTEPENHWLYAVGVDRIAEISVAALESSFADSVPLFGEKNIAEGKLVKSFWRIVSETLGMELRAVSAKEWLHLLDTDIEECGTGHPMYPVYDTITEEKGAIGVPVAVWGEEDQQSTESVKTSVAFLFGER